ncbi:MAG: hypothetical protein QUS33_00665 [Dehalococcoidia bacterium]|nr:hypothetical protein [Dehalococcoidia bacterium]
MIYVVYDNDYEVFLGANYRPESEVLIDTTERILSACEDIGVRMTLYCDVTCLWRYRELGHNSFPEAVDAQLQRAVQRGHDVQAHIHPHWLVTEIIRDEPGIVKYEFERAKFFLGNWIPEGGPALRRFCADVLRRAKTYLEDLLRPVNPSYRCIAFRAGGYGLQPNAGDVLWALRDAGYLIDSSVVPGVVDHSNVGHMDFSKVPRQGNYFISPETGLEQAAKEGLFEVPLVALRGARARWSIAKMVPLAATEYLRREPTPRPLGISIQSKDAGIDKRLNALSRVASLSRRLMRGRWGPLRLTTNASIMVDVTRSYIDQHGGGRQDLYFAVTCHSKSVHPAVIEAFKLYHHRLSGIYGNRLKAITLQEVARNLEGKLEAG